MRRIFVIFIMVIILLPVISNAQYFSGTIVNEEFRKYSAEKTKELLTTATKYSKDDIHMINTANFDIDPNLAYDICVRARKYSVDEAFLEELSAQQNAALIRILVKNETITSIDQIPVKSINIYDVEKEVEFQKSTSESMERLRTAFENRNSVEKKLEETKEANNEAKESVPHVIFLDGSEGTSLPIIFSGSFKPFTEEDYYMQMAELNDTRSPYQEKMCFLARIATYALVEKYPLNAEKFTYDYLRKFGYDQLSDIMITYFFEINEPAKAVKLVDFIINSFNGVFPLNKKEDLFQLKALAYANNGDMEAGINIINDMYEESLNKIEILKLKLEIFYMMDLDKTDPDKVKAVENEITMLHNDEQESYKKAFAKVDMEVPKSFNNDLELRKRKSRYTVFDNRFYGVTVAEMMMWIHL